MFVFCKKDVTDFDNINEVSYNMNQKYEAKIVDEDLLAKDNSGKFALISISLSEREMIGIKDDTSKWGKWFDEHFELIS